MNPRVILIALVLGFIGIILLIGVRTFIRWLKIHYPRRASAILAALAAGIVGTGVLVAMEIRDRPTFRANDLITLQEPVVAKTVETDRDSRSMTCVVDLHEHLGVVDVDIEGGTLRARVESNNTSASLYCPIGRDVRIELAWLHRMTVTRRQGESNP
jgi:hypothetical protein